jgi:uncharacterized protein DUF5667
MSPQMEQERIFELALDGAIPARGETASLVAIAKALSSLPDPDVDGRFAATLAVRLSEELAPVVPLRPVLDQPVPGERDAEIISLVPRKRRVRRGIAIALVAAMLGAVPIAAAAGASPRSPFYSFKRAIERMELAIFGTPLQDGFTYMKLADRRIAEARALGASPEVAPLVERLLGEASLDMSRAQSLVLRHTTDRGMLERLAGLARSTEGVLNASVVTMPEKAALARAIDSSRAVQQAVARALGSAPTVLSVPKSTLANPVSRVVSSVDGKERTAVPSSSNARAPQGSTSGPPAGSGDPLSPAEGCASPGSANGLGDALASAKLLLCR